MYRFGNLVNGEWRHSATPIETFNPARPAQRAGVYDAADVELAGAAVQAARQAQRSWARTPAAARTATLDRFIRAIEQRGDDLAAAITAEQGKTLTEARGEVAKSCAEARFMLAHALEGSGSGSVASMRPNVRNLVMRRPRGVIVAITPWNFPVMTPMRKIAPALAFGNALILKPSEFTPAAACLLADIGRETLPVGLLQLLHGRAELGDLLVRHRDVQGVTFTGSVGTGRKIRAATADNLAETSLELGGKNAAIVHDTDDLGACLDQIVQAALMCSGQRCTAVSRVIVRAELSDEAVRGLASRARDIVLGDGTKAATQLGPITHPAQLHHIETMVACGLQEGAKLVSGGHRVEPPGCETGYFYAPTVFDDVQPSMRIAREEIFGPVISVLSYRTIDEALQILNDVDYGLTAALFSNDARVIARFVDECETGMLHVNHGTIPDSHMPFGGVKASGVGAYSVGPSAAAFYTTEHSVYVGT